MATIDLTKRGPAGIDGTAITSGHGNPRASFGVEGWLYVNLSSTALFRKENGVWVAKFFMKGLKGDAGKRGISLRSGSGAPSDEVGNPGDAYFNVLNGDVYGPKGSNGTWPASPVGSLRGPQGVQGIQGIQGNVGAQGLQGIPGTPGTSVSPLVYAQLNKVLATQSDIVACSVYDTRRDSDLGWWRFKCQSLSWYNETLGTATRGMRKEFPAVVAIVLRNTVSPGTGALQIFDLTDLDGSGVPRLWMSCDAGSVAALRVATFAGATNAFTSVFALNGRIYVGQGVTGGSGVGALNIIDFVNDTALYVYTSTAGKFPVGLSQRNINSTVWATNLAGGIGGIVDRNVLSVHARAIAGSAVDAMGLTIPTVAVATAAGTSVILPSGVVWDITRTGGHLKVLFESDTELQIASLISGGNSAMIVGPIPTADIADSSWWRDFIDGGTSIPSWQNSALTAQSKKAVGSALGLVRHELTTSGTLDGSMVSRIAINYATGWLPGDTRGAYMCDGVTGNLVGSGELITNGDFPTDLSGWTTSIGGTGTVVQSGGQCVVTPDGTNVSGLSQPITTVIGQTYLVVVDISNSAPNIRIGTTAMGTQVLNQFLSIGKNLISFVATATTTHIGFAKSTAAATNIDNVSTKLAVADRSSKNKGLQVVGTLNRTAVNTGNDLVALSGFSAANYLEQPYNSDLDFTGDFSGSLWVNTTDTNAVILERAYYTGGAYSSSPGFRLLMVAGALSFRTSPDGFTTLRNSGSSPAINDGSWHLVTFCRRGTTLELWVDGVLVTSATVTVDNLTNSNAMMRVGIEFAGTLSFAPGSVALLRLSAYPPTAAQIAKMFADERPLFDLGAKAFLGGSSNDVKALDYDPDRNVLAVGTADGVSEFGGLVRFGYFDTTNCALTNDNMKCVSRRDGFRLYGGGADIIANRDLSFTADDAAMRAAYLRTLIPDTSLLATSADLAALSATVAGITVPVKGAGTDYWTGTDDAKFMTAKALRDAGALVPIASAATINLNGNSGLVFDLVLDHNASFALPTNLKNGETYTIIITQGTTGGTGAFNSAYDFRGVTPTLSVGAGKIDIVSGVYKASSGKLISSFSKAV